MSLQDLPAAIGATSLLRSASGAVASAPTAGAQTPAPPASLASIPLRRQRRRSAAPPEMPVAASDAAPAVAEPIESVAAPVGPAAAAAAPPDCESESGDILVFWKGLRGERRFPSWTDLQLERCAEDWPNSLLLRIPAESDTALPTIEASFSEVMRAAARRATRLTGSERPRIDHTPAMTEWLISLSQEAARAGRPISDEQLLPSWRGPARYRAVALPFSEDQAEIDHVLCHVAQA